jgi:hypothetical protein
LLSAFAVIVPTLDNPKAKIKFPQINILLKIFLQFFIVLLLFWAYPRARQRRAPHVLRTRGRGRVLRGFSACSVPLLRTSSLRLLPLHPLTHSFTQALTRQYFSYWSNN